MYLTFAVYAACIFLLAWGGSFAGFKDGRLHENSSSLEAMKSLRGFAAIGVILHHISQEDAFQWAAGGQGKPGELAIFVNAGFLFVSIFFFCSGFGLVKSLESKPGYLDGFVKRRIVRTVLVPYYVSVLVYGVFRAASGQKMPVAQWVLNCMGFTMMNEYAWYPIVAAILYLAFFLIFRHVKGWRGRSLLMAAVIILLGVVFCVNGHFAWWAGEKNWWLTPVGQRNARWWMQQKVLWFSGEWWVNSCPSLLVGMLFAHFEAGIRSWFGRRYWLKLVLLLVLAAGTTVLAGFVQFKFGYWSEFNGNGPGIGNKLVSYCGQIPQGMALTVLLFAVMLKYTVSNPVSRFFGGLSLETYMMNLIAITVFRFLIYQPDPRWGWAPVYKAGNYNLALYFAAVFAATVLLALLYRLLCGLVRKFLK
ncbi:MAG: acyltransferase [Treponema sp.]|nr:acyltransferase [Treponema sp.]